MFLLSTHGTVVCASPHDGTLAHFRPDRIGNGYEPVNFGALPGDPGSDFKAFLELSASTDAHRPTDPRVSDLALTRTKDLRTFKVARGETYMTAVPDGKLLFHSREANNWELYVGLSPEDLANIKLILSNEWVEASTGKLVTPETIGLKEGWRLTIGQAVLDLRLQFPAMSRDMPFRIVGMHEGWRIVQFFLYKPLMYFTAFKSPEVLKQLYLCLQSLLEFGRYEGPVHLITDQTAETILANVPGLDPSRLSIQTLHPADWVGYVAAKYTILEHEPAYAHQPVFFNDPDIIFDADIKPALRAIAGSDRIAAPIEGGLLRTFPSIGAALYQRDGFDPGFANGFNAGTMGLPNLRKHGHTFELIRSIIVNHALLHGRDYHRWVDQETANYVSFRIGHVNTHAISRYVRVGFPGTDETAEGRCGLVHFWASHPKGAVMENYVRTLRKADAEKNEVKTI